MLKFWLKPAFSVENRVDYPALTKKQATAHLWWPVKTVQHHCRCIAGGKYRCGLWGEGVVKGWLLGSGSHTNTVVALLRWNRGLGSPLKKLEGNGVFWCLIGHFFTQTKVAD